MFWHEFLQFWRMGGYAGYVWSAYGLAFLILGGNALRTRVRARRTRLMVRDWLKREGGQL